MRGTSITSDLLLTCKGVGSFSFSSRTASCTKSPLPNTGGKRVLLGVLPAPHLSPMLPSAEELYKKKHCWIQMALSKAPRENSGEKSPQPKIFFPLAQAPESPLPLFHRDQTNHLKIWLLSLSTERVEPLSDDGVSPFTPSHPSHHPHSLSHLFLNSSNPVAPGESG